MKNKYKMEIEKQASLISKAIPTIAKTIKGVSSAPAIKRVATGAGLGAGIGAVKGAVDSNSGSKANGVIRGAINGGLLGGVAGGSFSSKNISNLGGKVSELGNRTFDSAVSNKFGTGVINNSVSDIGVKMDDYGSKIKNYFKE